MSLLVGCVYDSYIVFCSFPLLPMTPCVTYTPRVVSEREWIPFPVDCLCMCLLQMSPHHKNVLILHQKLSRCKPDPLHFKKDYSGMFVSCALSVSLSICKTHTQTRPNPLPHTHTHTLTRTHTCYNASKFKIQYMFVIYPEQSAELHHTCVSFWVCQISKLMTLFNC